MVKVELGDRVRDTITGFQGIAIARTEWLNGCARVTIQPPIDKDGKHTEAHTFDEPQLEIVLDDIEAAKRKKRRRTGTGGPIPEPSRHTDPTR